MKKLLGIVMGIMKIIKRGFAESKITESLYKQPVYFYIFIAAFLIMRYAFIYNNTVFLYKGMIILLYSILAILLRNFAKDIKALSKESSVSKMSFVVTIIYHLAQIGALVLAFNFLK